MNLRWSLLGLLLGSGLLAQRLPESWRVSDPELAAYFAAEVARLEHRCLTDVQTLSDWQAQREERRRQLLDMLGLWPLPPRTDLHPVVTGVVDGDDFLVEKLQFQSQPGLYVTANLYVPKGLTRPAPAVLYVCGHSPVKTNDVSYGNKAAYQHHGIWFAQHGYVCLVLDTLQLGEIQGDHHGTYRLGQWWWNRRGYSPAGVEAWNGVRALDYLESRSEVDRQRIGMTGRSGGGSYTWTAAAIDERVRAAAPVAGMTDLRNQVVDGAVEGHCDCMFFVNTYRWDFPLNVALIAPRPLLLVNTDSDTLFPLDGVQRVFAEARRIYGLYDAYDQIGLVIGPGPHEDSQNLQVPVLRWFDRHLKGESPPLTDAAERLFSPDQLRVFETLPADQRNTRIQETFGPTAHPLPTDRAALRRELLERVFGGWPDDPGPLALREVAVEEHEGLRLRGWEFSSQPQVTLRLFAMDRPGNPLRSVRLTLFDDAGWARWRAALPAQFGRALGAQEANPDPASHAEDVLPGDGELWVWFAPRGLGPHAWPGDERKQIQLRRRFQLLGQTADGMRVWDIRRALEAVRRLSGATEVEVTAAGRLASLAALAALMDDQPPVLRLRALPESRDDEADLLNFTRVVEASRLREILGRHTQVTITP